MMGNPFEKEDGSYFVLTNSEGQHSLRPVFAEIPAGWSAVYGEADRAACLEYVTMHRTDLRPLSLIEAMAAAEK
ncbi:MbtH family protein [Kitasatospora sp. NBC_01250]